jgi:D-alanine-D-alanine ligase
MPDQRRIRVAVVFGGRSGEHAVSCTSAASVLAHLDRDLFDVTAIGITRAGRWLQLDPGDTPAITGRDLPEVTDGTQVMLRTDTTSSALTVAGRPEVAAALDVDVVFPLLHGPYGEDGTLQGLLELSGVPYVGAGVLASAIGMDKEYMKRVFTSFGLAVGPYTVIRPRDWARDRAAARDRVLAFAAEHGWPLFVKPARAGSSIGISKVDGPEGLDTAIAEARRHDPKVVVEALLRGREIECGVLEFEDGPRASVPAEIPPPDTHAYYDFEAKYIDSTPGIVPAPLTDEQTAEVQRLAVDAFEAASCEGLVRADFFLTEEGEFVINEINTMPGFTPISMFPQMWQATGVSYGELVDRLIESALRRSTGLR